MHGSDKSSHLTAVPAWYLDESGTDDNAPIAVIGGLLLNKSRFLALDEAWNPMLARHSISPPLHIKDFRRPNGRLADVTNEDRKRLFVDVVPLINHCKVYSIAATVTTEQYKKYFNKDFRKEGMGVYGAAFILCAQMTYLLAKQNNYGKRTPFLMDSGNPYADHVCGAHAAMQEEEWRHMNVGSLTFDKDEKWSPLQAADVIAWASRVKAQGDTFTNGYEPLVGLFDEAHAQEAYPEKGMAELAERLDVLRQRTMAP